MNYKSCESQLEQDRIKISSNPIENEIGEIHPGIFPFLENVLLNGELKDVFEKLTELQILSSIIALQPYIPEICLTRVPELLISLMTNPDQNISNLSIEIIYKIIASNSTEYAEIFCDNYFLQKCYEILKQESLSTTKCFWFLKSLSRIARIPTKSYIITDVIPLDHFGYLAQSDKLDEGSHKELLTLLLILSAHHSELSEESIDEFIDVLFCLFPFFLNDRSKHDTKCILQMIYCFSDCQKFSESILFDQIIDKLFEIIKMNVEKNNSNECDKFCKYAIGSLANFMNYYSFNLENRFFIIYDVLNSNFPLAAPKCLLFIRNAIDKYEVTESKFHQDLLELLLQIRNLYPIKVQIMILELILDILIFIDDEVLLQFIYEDSLMSIFIEVLEINDLSLVRTGLETLQKLLHRFRDNDVVKDSFIEMDGIDSLHELANELGPDSEDSSQLADMCEMLIAVLS